jgi:hypothetical protein
MTKRRSLVLRAGPESCPKNQLTGASANSSCLSYPSWLFFSQDGQDGQDKELHPKARRCLCVLDVTRPSQTLSGSGIRAIYNLEFLLGTLTGNTPHPVHPFLADEFGFF